VPAITLCTDLTHKQALGTSLAAMVLPALTGGIMHFRAGTLPLLVVVPLAVSTAAGAYIGSTYVAHNMSGDALKAIFSGFMIVFGVSALRSARPAAAAVSKLTSSKLTSSSSNAVVNRTAATKSSTTATGTGAVNTAKSNPPKL
jgi:uncharacterized membrane protein YfcA